MVLLPGQPLTGSSVANQAFLFVVQLLSWALDKFLSCCILSINTAISNFLSALQVQLHWNFTQLSTLSSVCLIPVAAALCNKNYSGITDFINNVRSPYISQVCFFLLLNNIEATSFTCALYSRSSAQSTSLFFGVICHGVCPCHSRSKLSRGCCCAIFT